MSLGFKRLTTTQSIGNSFVNRWAWIEQHKVVFVRTRITVYAYPYRSEVDMQTYQKRKACYVK